MKQIKKNYKRRGKIYIVVAFKEKQGYNQSNGNKLAMESFCTMYEEDVRPSLKQSTWLTKENIIQKKILPYLGKRKVSEITAKDVMDWHNQMRKLKTKTGKPLSPTYLKTIHRLVK